MSDADRKAQLHEFVAYAKTLRGDEKGEAQVFLDRLFRAFSRLGYKEAGATLEERVHKNDGGTGFADLVWKPVVLIEMKRKGEDLSRHLLQAFKYWEELVPGRPRYVVLCNFDEFRVYDFDQDIHQPQDTVLIDDLPERYGPLNFLWPTNEKPLFKVDREKVTRTAADLLAKVHRNLVARKAATPDVCQRFALQALICLFSEDIGLLPKHFFTQLLDECLDPPKAFDLLDGLFRAMNAREGTKAGRFKGVEFFNGGIFAQSAAIELDPASEVFLLKAAATYNWAEVSPDIFGTIFQHSMDADDRHAYGAHYTSQVDIMKIVGPTIVQPFTTAIERAGTLKELTALRDRLTTLSVLDPACGSGNFLYVAYREMRRLEAAIVAKQSEISMREVTGQAAFGHVSPRQFFGMDILPFAVELAKVTLSIAPKLASDELHTGEKTLPLDNLDGNIVAKDALIDENGDQAVWPKADVIIGNPPFLGPKDVKPERGAVYVKHLRRAYPDVPGMADYCVHWLRRAHDHLPAAVPADPYSGRAGLVGTQNIRNNQSRVGGLDHIVQSGVIVEAVESQPWSGEADVEVSIANWVKTAGARSPEAQVLIPSARRLWSTVDPTPPLLAQGNLSANPQVFTKGKRGRVRKDKSYELAVRNCPNINSALSDKTDVSQALVLRCNTAPQVAFQGITPGQKGFVLKPAEKKTMVAADPKSSEVVFPYLVGREVLTGYGKPSRFLIDFQPRDQIQASAYTLAFKRVHDLVLPKRQKNADKGRDENGKMRSHHKGFLEHWWRLAWERDDLLKSISGKSRFIACSRVTKRPVFFFLASTIRPGDALQTFALDDDYSFGVLQSGTHWLWFVTKCSKLTRRFRYTPESVFDMFPWPQSPTKKQIKSVAAAGREIRAIRDKALPTIKGGLRALYRTLELPGANPLKDAHAGLDAAVLDAYGFSPKKDLLKQLLDLNLSVAKAIDRGENVTAPGVPKNYGDPSDLITDDCIRP